MQPQKETRKHTSQMAGRAKRIRGVNVRINVDADCDDRGAMCTTLMEGRQAAKRSR